MQDIQGLISAFEGVSDAVFFMTTENILLSANPAAVAISQYSYAEVEGLALARMLPEVDPESYQILIGRPYRKSVAELASPLIRKDGTTVMVDLQWRVVDVNGTSFFQLIVVKAESQGHETFLQGNGEEVIKSVIQSIPDHIFIKDMFHRIVFCNQSTSACYGLTPDEMVGKTDYDFFSKKDADLFSSVEKNVFRGEPIINFEENYTLDGKERCKLSTKVPLYNAQGKVFGLIGINRDISDRKQMENELRSARVAAEQATVAKSAFLANMSHEIRTPLNAVIGMASLLSGTDLNAEQRDFVQTIETSGDALLALINDILDFSKIEAGQLRLEDAPFNLSLCVENALDIVAPRASKKGLELIYNTTGDVPQMFFGDACRLRQVLLNLLSNAIKFTHQGEVVVKITGRPKGDKQYLINFSVTDTGIGISPDVIHKIFNPFEQADTSTTRRFGGTGLGLSICKKLIELMGGDFEVRSKQDVGSEFQFHVSLKLAPTDDQTQTKIQLNVLHGLRVLVVDDNQTSLQILERQLKGWQMVPLIFTSGQDALDNLSSLGEVNLAILDMMMPDMDGLMLADYLRDRIDFGSRPIMILSSLGRRVAGDNLLIDDWICKPVKPDLLMKALVHLVEGREIVHKVDRPASTGDHMLGAVIPLRILVAEDNVVNQKVALKMLERLGYTADVVQDGREVLEAVEKKQYDLILMDVQMPVMDGIEATLTLKKLYPPERCPKVVAMSAHALQESRDEGMNCGMFDYLAKPIRLEDILRILLKVSGRNVN